VVCLQSAAPQDVDWAALDETSTDGHQAKRGERPTRIELASSAWKVVRLG